MTFDPLYKYFNLTEPYVITQEFKKASATLIQLNRCLFELAKSCLNRAAVPYTSPRILLAESADKALSKTKQKIEQQGWKHLESQNLPSAELEKAQFSEIQQKFYQACYKRLEKLLEEKYTIYQRLPDGAVLEFSKFDVDLMAAAQRDLEGFPVRFRLNPDKTCDLSTLLVVCERYGELVTQLELKNVSFVLSAEHVVSLLEKCPNLAQLSLARCSVKALDLRRTQELISLSIFDCCRLQVIRVASTNKIEELCIRGASRLGNLSLRPFVKLRSLEIIDCIGIETLCIQDLVEFDNLRIQWSYDLQRRVAPIHAVLLKNLNKLFDIHIDKLVKNLKLEGLGDERVQLHLWGGASIAIQAIHPVNIKHVELENIVLRALADLEFLCHLEKLETLTLHEDHLDLFPWELLQACLREREHGCKLFTLREGCLNNFILHLRKILCAGSIGG